MRQIRGQRLHFYLRHRLVEYAAQVLYCRRFIHEFDRYVSGDLLVHPHFVKIDVCHIVVQAIARDVVNKRGTRLFVHA